VVADAVPSSSVIPGLTPAHKSKVICWEWRTGMMMPDAPHTQYFKRPSSHYMHTQFPLFRVGTPHITSITVCSECCDVTDSSDWSAPCRASNTELRGGEGQKTLPPFWFTFYTIIFECYLAICLFLSLTRTPIVMDRCNFIGDTTLINTTELQNKSLW